MTCSVDVSLTSSVRSPRCCMSSVSVRSSRSSRLFTLRSFTSFTNPPGPGVATHSGPGGSSPVVRCWNRTDPCEYIKLQSTISTPKQITLNAETRHNSLYHLKVEVIPWLAWCLYIISKWGALKELASYLSAQNFCSVIGSIFKYLFFLLQKACISPFWNLLMTLSGLSHLLQKSPYQLLGTATWPTEGRRVVTTGATLISTL